MLNDCFGFDSEKIICFWDGNWKGFLYLGLMAATLASARTPTGALSSPPTPFILLQIGQVKMPTPLHIQDEIPLEDKSSRL